MDKRKKDKKTNNDPQNERLDNTSGEEWTQMLRKLRPSRLVKHAVNTVPFNWNGAV